MIEKVSISNFKSIKKVEFKAKRINLLIGEPNVGKSNILEALSLLSIQTLKTQNNFKNIDFIRFDRPSDLFFDISKDATISYTELDDLIFAKSLIPGCTLKHEKNRINVDCKDLKFSIMRDKSIINEEDDFLNLERQIIKYEYSEQTKSITTYSPNQLAGPYGSNLFDVIFNNNLLVQEFQELIDPYGFEALLSEDEGEFFLIKRLGKGKIKKLSFNLLAETFKRYLFFLAAIKTNQDATLLFEEPEVNSFPTYISRLAQEIVDSSNQYFIVTHSPYLYDQLISTVPKEEINILKVGFEDYSTTVKEIAYKDYAELNKLGVDVFFNLADL